MAESDLRQQGSLKARVTSIASSTAASMGMEVVLVELKGGGNRSIVRIFIDQPGGVTLDDCERFSKRVSVLLDVEDFIPFSYILEVSSPGLDRPLTKEEDFQRFVGRKARVRLRSALEGRRNMQGKILGVDQGRIRLELAPGDQVEIAVPEIERANLVIESKFPT
jgi:ribosome maturation factor RimP